MYLLQMSLSDRWRLVGMGIVGALDSGCSEHCKLDASDTLNYAISAFNQPKATLIKPNMTACAKILSIADFLCAARNPHVYLNMLLLLR